MIYQTSDKDAAVVDEDVDVETLLNPADVPPKGWEWMFNEPVFEDERRTLELIPRTHMDEDTIKSSPELKPHLEKYKKWRLKRDEELYS